MKAVSQTYKDNIKELGREIDAKITYTLNNETYTLNAEDINSISYHYEGAILKSVMKQLDIDSNQEIPIGTILECQFGVLVDDEYEYIDLGNFIVYSSEQQKDTKSYRIVCYDKMLYAMKDYETPKINNVEITYPITIRDYLNALSTHLGLTFDNISDTFPNYDKEIPNELYLDEEGNSLSYTFRDVLSELAQVTASTICINNNDELELRYINNTNTSIDEESLKDVNVNFGEIYGPINTITFKRSEDLDVYSLSNPIDLADNLKNEIVISNNQILNGDDRSQYAQDILNQLYGLTYSLNDFNSTGITYYELCDKYGVSINGTTYNCIMFNDEINISQGLEEIIHTDRPEESTTDYNTSTADEREDERTGIIINKKIGEVDIRGKTINLTGDNIQISSDNFSVDTDGNITSTGGTIAGYHITDNELYAEMYAKYDYTSNDIEEALNIWGNHLTPTPEQLEKYDLDGDGEITESDCRNLEKLYNYNITTTNPLRIVMSTGDNLIDSAFKITDGNNNNLVKIDVEGIEINDIPYKPYLTHINYEIGATTSTNAYITTGYISSSSTEILVNVYTDQPIQNYYKSLPVTVRHLNVRIRGTNGYLNNESSYVEYAGKSGYTLSAKLIGPNTINLKITKSSAFTNVTNNTPIVVEGYFDFGFPNH